MFIEGQASNSILHEVCSQSRVVPVVSIADPAKAVPLAQALQKGGIDVIEVTLRTPAALEAIEKITSSVKDMHVGAGTLLNAKQAYQAKKAGAHFGVSPGTTASLLDAAYDCCLPILPGISTASELMMWQDYGIDFFKFFPAEASGGSAFLASLIAVFPHIRFCPTGGITPEKAEKYLALSNVSCVGGSWFAPNDVLERGDWESITEHAQAAKKL